MSLLNVTKDIRKLAEEAERNKEELATAGLGLSGYVASQTGGSNINPSKPTNLTIQANEAQSKANQVKLNKQTQQYRSNVNLNQLDTSKSIKVNSPSEFKKSVRKNVIDATMNPPKFTAGPRPDYRPGAGDAKPTPTKKIPITPQGSPTLDAKGNPLRSPKGNVLKNIAGSTLSGIGNVADKVIKLSPLIIPDTELGDPYMDNLVGDLNSLRNTYPEMTTEQFNSVLSGNKSQSDLFLELQQEKEKNTFVPNVANTIPYSDRSDVEKRILSNSKAGVSLLKGTNTFNEPQMVDPSEVLGQRQNMLQDKDSLGTIRQDIPGYQSDFLKRIQEEEPITDREFQGAQQFALKRGMVFDPKEGYSKAEFFGQMYKGQTIGQFLRGEDAPEGFTDVIPQFEPGKTSSKEAKSEFVNGVKRTTKSEIGGTREIIQSEDGSYTDAMIPQRITELMLKPAGQRTDKENRRLASWANSTQGKGMGGLSAVKKQIEGEQEMTPYQKESLRMRQQGDVESLRRYEEGKQFDLERYEESKQFGREKFDESKRRYEEGIERDIPINELNELKTRAQVDKLILELEESKNPENKEELGFSPTDKDFKDYLAISKKLGYEYDFETGQYKEDAFGGRIIDEKTFREVLEPMLLQTKVGKALKFIEEQKKSK
jgi:hypothetical protein